MLTLDHLVLASTDLDTGEAWLRDRGIAPLAIGGRHPGWGTHNRLLRLGAGVYLELIASDPDQPEPSRPRPFGLDDPVMRARIAQRPRLVHWLLRADRIEADLAGLRYDPGPVSPMSRGDLRWRITLPAGGRPPGAGLLPSVIQWDIPATLHPAARLPDAGIRLVGFTVTAPPEVAAARPILAAPCPVAFRADAGPGGLRAELETPQATVVLD